MADIKNFGLRGVGGDLQLGKGGGRFVWNAGNGQFDFVLADGATLTNVQAANVAFAGSLTDGSVSIAKFVNEADGIVNNDDDISVPTSAAVIDYVTDAVSDFTGNLNISGDSGTDNIDLQSDTLNFQGNLNITTTVVDNEVQIALDDSISLGNVTVTGTVSGGTITDGTTVLNGGDITTTGTVSGGTLTDGTVTITGGDITGVDQIDATTGNITTVNSTTVNATDVNTTNVTATGDVAANNVNVTNTVTTTLVDATTVEGDTVQFSTLTDGTDSVTNIQTSTDGLSGDDAAIPTANAVINYVDAAVADFTGNLNISDGTNSDAVDLQSDVLTFTGNAQTVEAVVSDNEVTFDLADDVTIANDLNVGGDIVTGGGAGGSITGADLVQSVTVDATSNIILDGFTLEGVIDDDTFATATADTVATSESIKAYVDAEIAASDAAANLAIAGDTGSDTVDLEGQTLTVAGTINEIETSVTGQTVTVGLVDNPIVSGNLQVGGRLLTDDITSATVTVDGDAIISGNLTVSGTQTIVNSTEVEIADAVIRVNSDGAVVSAGLEANIGGTFESILFNPLEVVNPDSGDAGAWVFSDDLVVNTTAKVEDLVFTNLRANDNSDPNVISGFLSAAEGMSATDEKLPTANLVIEYVQGEISSLSQTLSFDGDTGTDTLDLLTGNLVFSGGTNITSVVTDDQVTFNLDDNVVLAGDITAVNGTLSGDLGVTGTATVGTLTDGTATLTGGDLSGVGTLTATTGNITTVNSTDVNATGTVTGGTLTDGTATLTGGDLTTTGTVDAGTVEFDSLSGTGAVAVTDIIDDDTMATASDTTLATSESVKAYVDTTVADFQGNLDIAGDSGAATIDFQDDTLTFAGTANEVETLVAGNVVTIGLPDDVTIGNSLTVSNELAVTGESTFTGNVAAGNITVSGSIVSEGGAGGTITGAELVSANSLVAGDNVTINGYLVSDILDEDDMVSDRDDALATQQSIKAYVDAQVAAGNDLSLEGDSGTGLVDLSTQNLEIAGTANEVETSVAGNVVTVGLPDDVTIGNSLTVTADFSAVNGTLSGDLGVTGTVTGGTLTDGAGFSATGGTATATTLTDGTLSISTGTITGGVDATFSGTVDAGTVEFDNLSGTGAVSVTDIIDDDSMATASDTTLATSESVKAYVDAEVGAIVSNITIAGDAGAPDEVLTGETLTFTGGTNITTTISNNEVTIDLDDDVTLAGNLSIGGTLNSDDITASQVTVDGDAVITGNLTVQGTQTIVDSEVVEIADSVIRVNSDGAVVSAGLEANVGGVIKQFVYDPVDGRWEAEDGIYSDSVEFASLSGTGAVEVTDILDDDTMATASNTTLATSESVKAYIDGLVSTVAAGDGLVLRGTATASGASVYTIGTMPNVSGRTYYGATVRVKVTTAFSDAGVDHITVEAGGVTLVAEADADAKAVDTYVIELDGDEVLAGGGDITLTPRNAGGVAVAASAGVALVSVSYHWTA